MRVAFGSWPAGALLAALLLAFCASPACCRGRSLVQMQNMPAAGQFPLFGQPKLTAEQASRLTGVWRMASSDEHFRLDGSLYDGVLLEALQAEGGAADLQDVASRSIDLSSSLMQYQLIIPSVDARTGMFVGYRATGNSTSSNPGAAQPGFAFGNVKRVVGAVVALPDGALSWQGVENVDTAIYDGTVLPGGEAMDILRVEGGEVWSADGSHTLDDQSIVQLRLTRVEDEDDVAGAIAELVSVLPLKTVRQNETSG